MATLGPLHPAVIDIEAQAARLHGMIAEEINRTAISARSDYETAKADEQTLTGHLARRNRPASPTAKPWSACANSNAKSQAARTVYEAFLVRAREASAQEQLDTKNIHVLSKAEPPLGRSWPPPTSIMALAAILSASRPAPASC